MDWRAFWQKRLEEAEREQLDAARGRTALNAAAKNLQWARAMLKRIERENKPKRQATRGHGSEGAAS
jgi:hypothetical protein